MASLLCNCLNAVQQAITHKKYQTQSLLHSSYGSLTLLLISSLGSLSILRPIDREEQDLYNLTIVAEDHGLQQHSSSQLLSIQVIDVNDEAPYFEESEYEAFIAENQPAGTTVLVVSASDMDQGKIYSSIYIYIYIGPLMVYLNIF